MTDAHSEKSEPLSERGVSEAAAVTWLRSVEVLPEVDSTNARLLAAPAPPFGQMHACLAEHQSQGRGRRGRAWYAPSGGLYLSMAWQFERRPPALAALSLVAGVAALQALQSCGAEDLQLKWPNDLVWHDGKLGGILVELKAEGAGPVHAVIGVGVNVRLPSDARRRVGSPGWGKGPVDLTEALGRSPSRNLLAGRLIAATGAALTRFEQEGFEPFAAGFDAVDYLYGRDVRAAEADGEIVGRAQGVDAEGALQVVTREGVRRVYVGEVSVVVGL